jgi:hypothetical protein
MTITSRNALFRADIIVAFLFLLAAAAASLVIIPVFPAVSALSTQRSAGITQSLLGAALPGSPYAAYAAIIFSVVYALVGIILTFYFFEKTPAPEIPYIAFFIISFSFEAIRLIVPLRQLYELPTVYLVLTARTLLFGRYFGLFALFIASVCASGLDIRKQHNVVFALLIATLTIALGIPIDGLSWDSAYSMIIGYTSMFMLVEAGLILITVISFLIAAHTQGDREYTMVGAGSFMALLGRDLLLGADTWASPVPGLLFLALGTWFMCTRLHKVYLWL